MASAVGFSSASHQAFIIADNPVCWPSASFSIANITTGVTSISPATEELETTGTFKLKKNDLREEAYHLDKVKGDQIFIKKPGQNSYVPLDRDYYEIIESGEAGF